MPRYLSLAGFLARFGAEEVVLALNDRTEQAVDPSELDVYAAGGTVSAAAEEVGEIMESLISDAEDEALSYIGAYYPAVLADGGITEATAPRLLKRKTGDIARLLLHENRPRPSITEARESAIEWLTRVASGRVGLGLVDDLGTNDGPAPSGGVRVSLREDRPSRVFGSSDQEDRYLGRV